MPNFTTQLQDYLACLAETIGAERYTAEHPWEPDWDHISSEDTYPVLGGRIVLTRNPNTRDYYGAHGSIEVQVYRHQYSRPYKGRRTRTTSGQSGWNLRIKIGGTVVHTYRAVKPANAAREATRYLHQLARSHASTRRKTTTRINQPRQQ